MLLPFIASAYLRFVGFTSRILWVRRSIRTDLEKTNKGFIYAFWHSRQAFLTYLHAGDKIHPLISKSKDGEIIAQVCHHFGLEPARGSSSRGGMEATRELLRWIEVGDRIGITPDGPKGPREEVQDGILYLAQKTGAAIVPVACGAKRRWIFNSWDGFQLPQPFNRISMVYGQPLYVKEGDNFQTSAAQLQNALHQVTQEADAMAQGIAYAS